MRGRGRPGAVLVASALLLACCGPRSVRGKLLEAGAVNVGGEIGEVLGERVSVLDASFSPGSDRVLVEVLSVVSGETSLWTYRIEDGSLVQNGLKPGWTLHAAAFFGSGDRILLAVQRPDPPSYRLYQTRVGSSDWANLTDLVPTAYVEIIDLCPSPDGETLAVVSAAGGHSDLTVSRGGDRLVETQVYPGYVEPLGWDRRGTKLYVESDMPLHLGTTMELREKNAAFDASMAGGIDSDVYVIDVEDQVVEVAPDDDVPSPDVSPDGRFKLHLIAIDETVTGLFLTGR